MSYRHRLAGADTGSATALLVGTSPVLAAIANDARIAISLDPAVAVFIGTASSFNATTACIGGAASGARFTERDYRGEVWVKAEGATGVVRRWEV